jgi:cell wall-associated NlpC family hydrolase
VVRVAVLVLLAHVHPIAGIRPARSPVLSQRASLLTAAAGLTVVAGLLIATTASTSVLTTTPAASVAGDWEGPPLDAAQGAAGDGPKHGLPPGWEVERRGDPDQAVVRDTAGEWVATFTDGASTVTLVGSERRFDEDTADHGVTTDEWVRVLPEPFDGRIDAMWLADALDDDSPDVLEVLTQYWEGAPDVVDDGVLISAEAGYGPLQPDGSRPVGSDWHDFQGVEGVYPDTIDPPDPEEYRSLDCSGYVRLVYGVRFGLPLSFREGDGSQIPRRSMQQAAKAPGVTPIENTGEQVQAEQLERLAAGDLVFFDAPSDDDGEIDHVGFYLGVDDAGHHRFVHSRRSVNGPTMGGDEYGASVLDDGFFGEGFRSSRRL